MQETNDVIATQMTELYALYNIQYILGQMYANLALISEGASGAVITVNNTSLYSLAAKYYGDATAWTVIAEANGLIDPMITDIMTIVIPSNAVSTGGILDV